MSTGEDVIVVGDGAIPLLALHGIQGTRAAWLAVAEALASDCQTVLPNLRGRGRAPRGQGPEAYTLEVYAHEAARIAQDKFANRPFLLAGWSMGVSVALAWLTRHEAPCPAGLVLLSGSPCLCKTQWFRSTDGDALQTEIAEREKRLGLREAADHDAVAWTWQAIRDTDQRATLSAIQLPTLILHGRADEDNPCLHAEWLETGIVGSRLVAIEGAGHSLLTQNTDTVVTEIRRFAHTVMNAESPACENR